jgi:hypothetical protein
MSTKQPMTIRELREALQRKPADSEVLFDFVYFAPKGCGSYRGDYAQPSIGYGTEDITVAGVLELLDKLTSDEFVGYKGGNYLYDDSQADGNCGRDRRRSWQDSTANGN